MPTGASPKREREYKKLKSEFQEEGRYRGREEEVAARIVNKQRAERGETKAARSAGAAKRSGAGTTRRAAASSGTSGRKRTAGATTRATTKRAASAKSVAGRRSSQSKRASSKTATRGHGAVARSTAAKRAAAKRPARSAAAKRTTTRVVAVKSSTGGRKTPTRTAAAVSRTGTRTISRQTRATSHARATPQARRSIAGAAQATTRHDEIRRWVEEHGGHPAQVKRTAARGGTGILRIDYPGYSGKQTLEEISWDEFFEKFEQKNLAFIYQDRTKTGRPSRFSKLVKRETAATN